MKKTVSILLASMAFVSVCQSQVVHNDVKSNFYITQDSMSFYSGDTTKQNPLSLPVNTFGYPQKNDGVWLLDNKEFQSRAFSSNDYLLEPATTFIPLWRNSRFMASGEIISHPGLMEIHSGTIGIMQNVGKLTFYVGGEAYKYGFFNGLNTRYGLNGTIQYHFSSTLTFSGYATYYFGRQPLMSNGTMIPLSMMGYYGVSSFGGTIEYQFNETFGLIVGGEAVQQLGTNRYRFEPIVTPTVKIGQVKIGLPVGRIVHDIIREHIENRRRH